jgi:hypothetical protein
MKAYMIADLNNPTSVKYTEIALESWSKQSLLDIEVIQCYTPDTISELEPLYNWQPLLQKMQKGKDSSKSERAGDITHWQLIKKRAESKSRFFVMEHDSYLEDVEEFKRQFDFTMEHGLDWANLGLFMSCYSFSRRCAILMNDLLLNQGFPLNGGPYGCAERLVKTYLTHKNNNDRPYTWMTHHPNTRCVSAGATAKELYETYNFFGTNCQFTRATTQVVSKSIGITQVHDGMVKEPWLRNRKDDFKVIP